MSSYQNLLKEKLENDKTSSYKAQQWSHFKLMYELTEFRDIELHAIDKTMLFYLVKSATDLKVKEIASQWYTTTTIANTNTRCT